MDGYPLDHFPIEVKVAVDNMDIAEKLYNRMQVSNSAEEFFIQNFRLSISTPQPIVSIPAYKDTIKIRNMELGILKKEVKHVATHFRINYRAITWLFD